MQTFSYQKNKIQWASHHQIHIYKVIQLQEERQYSQLQHLERRYKIEYPACYLVYQFHFEHD
jgi:hypothetical protein